MKRLCLARQRRQHLVFSLLHPLIHRSYLGSAGPVFKQTSYLWTVSKPAAVVVVVV